MEIVFQESKKKNQFEFVQVPDKPNQKNIKPKKEVRFKSNQTQRTDLESFARPQPSQLQANVNSGGQGGEKQSPQYKNRSNKSSMKSLRMMVSLRPKKTDKS
jgi:hypothetical protein